AEESQLRLPRRSVARVSPPALKHEFPAPSHRSSSTSKARVRTRTLQCSGPNGAGRSAATHPYRSPISQSFTLRQKVAITVSDYLRSEERRVGKECRSRW